MLSLSMLLFNIARRKMGTTRLHRTAAQTRRAELTSQLHALLGNRVLAGPFAGMVLPTDISWRDGDFMPKLIGSYESNLRAVLAQAIARGPVTVINVGCAEGYYAVGLARLLPQATVYAFDISTEAGAICARAAAENGVTERVVVDGRCTTEHLAKMVENSGRTLLVMDCEGAERELLDPAKLPGLAKCDVIVETHGSDIVVELEARFRPSHEVNRTGQGGRDPNEVPELRQLAESDRWLLVDEGRPESMVWLALWAKTFPAK
jgi:SAM-dependent methyltransferase